jgi:hypothetical protein
MAKPAITGLDEMRANLSALPGVIAKGILRKPVRQGANMIAGRAKENFSDAVVSIGGSRSDTLNPHMLSGALRSSIRVVERRGTPTKVVFQVMAGGMSAAQQKKWGMSAPYYSLWVERGHINRKMGQALRGPKALQQHYRMNSSSNTPAHPYLAPAVESEKSAVIDGISDAVKEGLAEL